MSPTLLISGPPGCGKTSWILNRIRNHRGPCGFLRLVGYPDEGLLQARDGGIDLAWLQDQYPGLLDLADPDQALAPRPANLLALIELPQFQPPADSGLAGVDRRVIPQLEAMHLSPDEHLHFGRDDLLPLSGDNEVGRSATSSLAGWVSAGVPGADAQGPGDAGTTDESPTQPVHGETTRWQQPGGCCRSGGHFSAQCPPD
jgi:hypothetical protein